MMKHFFVLSAIVTCIINGYMYFFIVPEKKSFNKQLLRFDNSIKKHAVVVICAKKTKEYRETLEALFKARGLEHYEVIASHSRESKDSLIADEVREITDSFGIKTITHIDDIEQTQRLARHFQWTFNTVFEMYNDIEGIIVLEDDLLVSPDFLEYFELTIPILNTDPKLKTISAWNDNGFKGVAQDPHALRRSTFFPGLGWYLSKDFWKDELNKMWPMSDWDWIVRRYFFKNKYEVIIPEISRDYHVAKTGTYMNRGLFNQYFKNVNYNTNESFRWNTLDTEVIEDYESHVKRLFDDPNIKRDWMPNVNKPTLLRYGRKYKIWWEDDRGSWKGIRFAWKDGVKHMIINKQKCDDYFLPRVTL